MEKTTSEAIDHIDLRILRCLQADSNVTTKELAAKVHLSVTPVFERVRRLERNGYIRGYVAILDGNKLNHGFTVFCMVKLKQLNTQIALSFVSAVGAIDEVVECYNISGEYDYMLKIQVPDMRAYQQFLIHKLGNLDMLGSLQSHFVMAEEKNTHGIPLPAGE